MSVAIKNALTKLDKALDRVEANIPKSGKSRKSNSQHDLFAVPQANVLGFDRTALTKKLDMTIAKVEQLLGEA